MQDFMLMYIYMPEKGQSPYPDMPDIHIGEAGVLKLLNNINSQKATGPDGIPASLLHEYASYIAPALTKIFQISVNTGTIPDEWRNSEARSPHGHCFVYEI